MRSSLLLLTCFVAPLGCSMENPAFGDAAGTVGETGTTQSTSSSTTNTTGTDAPEPVCDLVPGQPLKIDLGPAGCNTDTPEQFDRLFQLVEATGDKLMVYSCPDEALDCSTCESDVNDIVSPLTFTPLMLDNLAPEGTCLRIRARRVDPTNPDACRFQTVTVETETGQSRIPLLLGRNAANVGLPLLDVGSPLAAFEPITKLDDSCDCETYPSECCDGVAPTTFAYDIGLADPVEIGGMAELQVPTGTYVFRALDAYQSGVCGEPTSIAWALVRKPL